MAKEFADKDWDWKRKLQCIREIDPDFGSILDEDANSGKGRWWARTNIKISYDGIDSRKLQSPGHDTEEEMVNEWFRFLTNMEVGGRVIIGNDQYSYGQYTGKFRKLTPAQIGRYDNNYLIYGDGDPDFALNTARDRMYVAQSMEMNECLCRYGTLVPPKPKNPVMCVVSAIGTGLTWCGLGILAALGLATWRSKP
jgi:hypothetical protein